jgi:hypothetical protein
MMDGYITYQGPARDSTLHFSKIGFVCPGQTNPADFYMRILSINYPKTKADDEKIEKI